MNLNMENSVQAISAMRDSHITYAIAVLVHSKAVSDEKEFVLAAKVKSEQLCAAQSVTKKAYAHVYQSSIDQDAAERALSNADMFTSKAHESTQKAHANVLTYFLWQGNSINRVNSLLDTCAFEDAVREAQEAAKQATAQYDVKKNNNSDLANLKDLALQAAVKAYDANFAALQSTRESNAAQKAFNLAIEHARESSLAN